MSQRQRVQFADRQTEERFDRLVNKWKGCQFCPDLCRTRTKLVHFRGFLPCDILFVGEAPGESEDALGFPFIGPAGEEFNELLYAAISESHDEPTECRWCGRCTVSRNTCNSCGGPYAHLKFGITNICCCWPHTPNEMETGKPRPPTKEEAAACSPRLREMAEIASPKIVIALGRVAARYFHKAVPQFKECNLHELLHPSAILRMKDNPSNQEMTRKKWVLALANYLKEVAH